MADPIEQNILGVQSLVGSKLNKIESGAPSNPEGVTSEFADEFTLDLTDEELIKIATQLELDYAGYEGKIKPRQLASETYYLGKQKDGGPQAEGGAPISANLLFEAAETFYPAALSKNPEPVVWSDDTPEGQKLASDVKTMLQYHADTLNLRGALIEMTRKWSVDFIGVLKHGWDTQMDDITVDVRDAKKFVFDKDGYVDRFGDFQGMLGERITTSASKLIGLFPKHKDYITVMVDGKLGTKVIYTEWWDDEYCFYTFKGRVLDKNKNPNFNYPTEELITDIDGNTTVQETGGKNHFGRPKKPYTFLSVFSFGDQPHDVTGLIEQNIPNQRRISRRTEQIDYNLSRANNSDVFSENNFNQETAKQAARGLTLGHPILVPSGGPISEAIHRLQAPGIDNSFFNELENSKNDLKGIFGTQGISSSAPDEDQTARGMILNNQHDSSRIGGGVGDKIETVADNVFNVWTQFYHVYYDVKHFASIMGKMRAVEYVSLSSEDMTSKLVVSVSPDSMKPRDEITEMNQALALWDKGALDPKTLLTKLNFPDPQNTAAQVVLWNTNPQLYLQLNFPDLQAQMMEAQMVGGPPQPGGGVAPEEVTEPAQGLGVPAAGASLSEVPLT